MIITIDGPSASGKSSLAQKLAQQLNYIHINSGFLYRAAAVIFSREFQNYSQSNSQVSKQNFVEPKFSHKFLQIITQLKYIYNPATNRAQVYYLDEDLTPALKTTQVSQMASVISANPEVREIINQLQRDLVAAHPENSYIADGRDCGSVVFPQANLKIFLTASLPIRAERLRQDLLCKQLAPLTIEHSLAELVERDQRDQNRAVAPLIVPTGGVIIDSSDLTLEQVVQKILALIAN
jgi:cytidylate kinase